MTHPPHGLLPRQRALLRWPSPCPHRPCLAGTLRPQAAWQRALGSRACALVAEANARAAAVYERPVAMLGALVIALVSAPAIAAAVAAAAAAAVAALAVMAAAATAGAAPAAKPLRVKVQATT